MSQGDVNHCRKLANRMSVYSKVKLHVLTHSVSLQN